jgi:hypothetical protein
MSDDMKTGKLFLVNPEYLKINTPASKNICTPPTQLWQEKARNVG